jgi:hypothetical protein
MFSQILKALNQIVLFKRDLLFEKFILTFILILELQKYCFGIFP